MKKVIKKSNGTKITIESDDEELFETSVKRIEQELKKANQIRKIEPIDKIDI